MKKMIACLLVALTFFRCKDIAESPSAGEWMGTIGHGKSNPDLFYSLLFLGYVRQELSPVCKGAISDWLKMHPAASMVSVAIDEKFDSRNSKSKLIFVWVVDGAESLGVDLVGNGCASANFLYTVQPGTKLQISPHNFQRMKDRLVAAETSARAAKLGIWSESSLSAQDEEK